jgi:hypothetical protein
MKSERLGAQLATQVLWSHPPLGEIAHGAKTHGLRRSGADTDGTEVIAMVLWSNLPRRQWCRACCRCPGHCVSFGRQKLSILGLGPFRFNLQTNTIASFGGSVCMTRGIGPHSPDRDQFQIHAADCGTLPQTPGPALTRKSAHRHRQPPWRSREEDVVKSSQSRYSRYCSSRWQQNVTFRLNRAPSQIRDVSCCERCQRRRPTAPDPLQAQGTCVDRMLDPLHKLGWRQAR